MLFRRSRVIIKSMKYVFFDIECASVYKNCAKICAFGYCVCDEHFQILKKKDLLINPRGKFDLTDREGKKGIVLPYDYADFKKYPTFKSLYPRIKELLEDKDALIVGHAVMNDVKYLNLETRRFKLPSFNFEFIDTQMLFMSYINDFSKQYGLEDIAARLKVRYTPHRAAEDAYATSRILAALCKKNKCNVEQLLGLYGFKAGRIENYNIFKPQCSPQINYERERRKIKNARTRARIKFENKLAKMQTREGKLNGAAFMFTRAIEDDIKQSVPLVDRIYAAGGTYAKSIESCNYFVQIEDDDSGRLHSAQENENITVINLSRLEELLK